MYSIAITTYCNPEYLRLCIDSILENSYYKTHQICVHVNGHDEESVKYLNSKNIKHTMTQDNVGVADGVVFCLDQATCDNVLIANDDYYFTKDWDYNLHKWELELNEKFNDYKKFIGFQICEPKFGSFPPICHAGKSIDEFDVDKLNEYISENSTHKARSWLYGSIYPTEIVTKFKPSQDFYPKSCFDIDFIMQILKHLKDNDIKSLIFSAMDCYIYHFQSKSSIKNKTIDESSNSILFEKKWNMSVEEAYGVLVDEINRSISLIGNKTLTKEGQFHG